MNTKALNNQTSNTAPKYKRWPDHDVEDLTLNIKIFKRWDQMPWEELAAKYGRTVRAVQDHAYRLGLYRGDPNYSGSLRAEVWSDEEVEYFKHLWKKGALISEIARRLNRTGDAVKVKRMDLGFLPRARNSATLQGAGLVKIFDYDDLFVTVSDKILRAYNRLIFITVNYNNKPKLKSIYFQQITAIEPKALVEIGIVKRLINSNGLLTFQKSMRHHINPEIIIRSDFDVRCYATYTKPHIPI